MPKSLALLTLLLLLILAGSAAVAADFEVRLHNGNVFETRYAPFDAPFDETMTMFLSGQSNWLAVPKDAIAEVVSTVQASGRGTYIDHVTVLIGAAPNDNPTPEEEAAMEAEAAAGAPAGRPYSMPLISEPGATGGLPLSFLGVTTPPMGGVSAGSALTNQRRLGGGGAVTAEPFSREYQ